MHENLCSEMHFCDLKNREHVLYHIFLTPKTREHVLLQYIPQIRNGVPRILLYFEHKVGGEAHILSYFPQARDEEPCNLQHVECRVGGGTCILPQFP